MEMRSNKNIRIGDVLQELGYINEDQINQAVGMNQPIEKLLYEFALRSDCEDIQNFSDVFCSRNAVAVIFTKL